jgi:hypothetical protein
LKHDKLGALGFLLGGLLLLLLGFSGSLSYGTGYYCNPQTTSPLQCLLGEILGSDNLLAIIFGAFLTVAGIYMYMYRKRR